MTWKKVWCRHWRKHVNRTTNCNKFYRKLAITSDYKYPKTTKHRSSRISPKTTKVKFIQLQKSSRILTKLGISFKLNMQINNWNLKLQMHNLKLRKLYIEHAKNSSLICWKQTNQKALLY